MLFIYNLVELLNVLALLQQILLASKMKSAVAALEVVSDFSITAKQKKK